MLYDEKVEFSELAKLTYDVCQFSAHRYLWKIDLNTRKFHQIRAQLASLGCPIEGDILYGSVVP